MIALIQRVLHAQVSIAERVVGMIDGGVVALVGVRHSDDRRDADRLLERMLGYRIFADAEGRMNLDLARVHGGLLLVPQFTLAADTGRGMRPGFSTAASAEQACALFGYLLQRARARHQPVASGEFGSHMRLSLINDGPVTFWLET